MSKLITIVITLWGKDHHGKRSNERGHCRYRQVGRAADKDVIDDQLGDVSISQRHARALRGFLFLVAQVPIIQVGKGLALSTS